MTQHLNLLGPGLHQQRQHWTLAQAGAGLGLLVLLGLAGALVLDDLASQARADVVQAQQAGDAARARLAELQGQARQGPAAGVDAELARLRQQLGELDRVRALVASGQVGRPQGHAELLLALARQADPAVWITGLQVSADHDTLELRGRMTDPAALPVYLARLQQEPLFHGRRFAQLQLRRVNPSADATGGSGSGSGASGSSTFGSSTLGSNDAAAAAGNGSTLEFILRSPPRAGTAARP
jgi:Tfp pilus assembly protein PilN